MYTFGSLFAGIGGIDLGFERAGLKCKWQVEIDDYATKVLEKNWPNVPRWRDVKTFPPATGEKWYVDVIAGGFPCQDISKAGKGRGLAGEKSALFYEIIRVARCIGPKAIVLENVAALLARGMGDVLQQLAAIGFDAEWHCIPASAVGAPHFRDRVFIVGYANDRLCNRTEQKVCSGRSVIELPSKKQVTQVADSDSKRRCGGEAQWQNAEDVGESPRCQKFRHWDFEPDVGRVANGVPARVDRLRGLGNAVVPQVAELVAELLIRKLEMVK